MADEPIENVPGDGSEGAPPRPPDDDHWLDRPSSINAIIGVLVAACVLSVAADLFYHKHGYWAFQEWWAFDAVFGFLAYVGLVTTAKGVRKLLMRSEDYYD